MSFTSHQSGNSDLRNALRALAPERESFKGVSLETSTPEEKITTPRVPAPLQMPRATISESGIIERARPDVGRDDRRKIILALIKQKPSLTVKDIAKSIPGVSEKTIQRELLAMVAESILVKRGERRWSTYSLHT
jgi:predicted HTH transcriptional regulator